MHVQFSVFADRLVRIAGGIVLVTYQHHMDSQGWTIAAIVLQGAGVFPLLVVQVGYLMIVYVIRQWMCNC